MRHRAFALFLRIFIRMPERQAPLPAPEAVERLLIIKLDEIGDFVLSTPFLRAIRKRYAQATITLVVNKSVQTLASACPYVDEVIPFSLQRRRPPLDQIGTYLQARRFAREHLRGRGFQCAVVPRADIDNGGALPMAYHARIPVRVGYTETVNPLKALKNAQYHRFLTHPIDSGSETHDAAQTLRVAACLGADVSDTRLELWPSEDERKAAAAMLGEFRQSDRLLIALSPGASLDRRRWPMESFAALACRLIEELGAQIVVIGGPGDAAQGNQIAQSAGHRGVHVLNAAGRTSLGETAALLELCAVFVGNDSGPMHIAAAMQLPCVELSCHPVGGNPVHANSPLRYAPWMVPHRILQPHHALPPCSDACMMSYAHCIRQITVERVFEATRELLTTRSKRQA